MLIDYNCLFETQHSGSTSLCSKGYGKITANKSTDQIRIGLNQKRSQPSNPSKNYYLPLFSLATHVNDDSWYRKILLGPLLPEKVPVKLAKSNQFLLI